MPDEDNAKRAFPGALVEGLADGLWFLGTLAWFDETTKHWTVTFTVSAFASASLVEWELQRVGKTARFAAPHRIETPVL